ncbi:MAG TPA: hypothetical protein PKD26_13680 [Pyrinomonadaceae bacterium]|nr:hypothetical protein [Pyrinomonadaceae bacterium]
MNVRCLPILSLIAIFVCVNAYGQDGRPGDMERYRAGSTEALKKLEFLVGEWKGTGWALTPTGKQTSQITEVFRYKLGGQIAVVEGLGMAKDEKTGAERATHQAFGVFSYDHASGKIRFRFYKAETGEEGEVFIEPSGKSITWGFDVKESGSKIKFVQQISPEGKWIETGDFSRDGGKTWMRFMEMELTRVQ